MTSYVTPKKNTEFIFHISLVSQADTKIFQANPTIAAGDFKVATDDAAPGNLTTIPTVDADFTKRVKVTLSAAEMNGDNVTMIASDVAGAEWADLTINIQTTARQIDDLDTLGAGAITWTYTLTDDVTGALLADASVWVTSDSAGATVIASGTTNDAGVVTFYLDAGQVFVWRSRAGYNFDNPDSEIVS